MHWLILVFWICRITDNASGSMMASYHHYDSSIEYDNDIGTTSKKTENADNRILQDAREILSSLFSNERKIYSNRKLSINYALHSSISPNYNNSSTRAKSVTSKVINSISVINNSFGSANSGLDDSNYSNSFTMDKQSTSDFGGMFDSLSSTAEPSVSHSKIIPMAAAGLALLCGLIVTWLVVTVFVLWHRKSMKPYELLPPSDIEQHV